MVQCYDDDDDTIKVMNTSRMCGQNLEIVFLFLMT